MKTKSQPKLVSYQAIGIIALVLITLNASTVLAQYQRRGYSRFNNKSDLYVGFGGSFGVRCQKVTSEHAEINDMPLVQEGGSGVFTIGKKMVRAKLEAGFYYSSASVRHTVDLVELASSFNFYPLQLMEDWNKKLQPYVIAGVMKNQQKFYGFYHMDETQNVNYSVTIEPFIGKAVTTQGTLGAGLEYSLRDDHSFVHLFAEAKYSKILSSKNTETLTKTGMPNQLMFNIGVVFGRHF